VANFLTTCENGEREREKGKEIDTERKRVREREKVMGERKR